MEKRTLLLEEIQVAERISFPCPLVVCPITGSQWVVMHDFLYHYRPENGEERVFIVKAGFTTDFASVPSLIWSVLPTWSAYGWAAVVHDWLYWMQEEEEVSKEDADEIFRQAMVEGKVISWRVAAIYRAVAWFGRSSWEKNAEAKKNGDSRMVALPERGPYLVSPRV